MYAYCGNHLICVKPVYDLQQQEIEPLKKR